MSRPILLHLGEPIRWNHQLYKKLGETFDIVRNESLTRDSFIQALKGKKYGDFFAMYRPFWNSGIEMGNWDNELMYAIDQVEKCFSRRPMLIEILQQSAPAICQDIRKRWSRL
jgi:hypothetical protein